MNRPGEVKTGTRGNGWKEMKSVCDVFFLSPTDVGSLAQFGFITNVLHGVEGQGLCKPIKFFHTKINHHVLRVLV